MGHVLSSHPTTTPGGTYLACDVSKTVSLGLRTKNVQPRLTGPCRDAGGGGDFGLGVAGRRNVLRRGVAPLPPVLIPKYSQERT